METVEHTASQTETACLHRIDMWLQFSFFTLAFWFPRIRKWACKCASAILFVEFLFLGCVAGIPTWTSSCEWTLWPRCGRVWTGRAGLSGCSSSPHQQHPPPSPNHQLTYALWFIQAVRYTSATGGLFFFSFSFFFNSQNKSETGEACFPCYCK